MAFNVLLDPLYSIQGVGVELILAGRTIALRAIDKTAGADTGDTFDVPTIRPAACVRVAELTQHKVKVRSLPGATIEINGFIWEVQSYRLRPSPLGENDGEVLLVLAHKQVGSKPLTGTFDFNAILYDPIYLIHGVPISLSFPDSPSLDFELTGLDKTAGINVGDNVAVPTIKPAAVVRYSDITMVGLTPADLPGAIAEFNGFAWTVMAYRFRPSPDGEAEGEVLLILSGQAVAVPRRLVAALFTDDLGLAARLRFEAHLVARIQDDAGLLAAIRKDRQLSAFFMDQEGVAAHVRREFHLNGAFTEEGEDFFAALRHPVRIRASYHDESGFLATLTMQYNVNRTFHDEGGFAFARLTLNTVRRVLATFTDEDGLGASIRVTHKKLVPFTVFADEDGFTANLIPSAYLVAAFADEDGFTANLIPSAHLAATFADEDGFMANLIPSAHLAATFTDDLGVDATLTVEEAGEPPGELVITFKDNAAINNNTPATKTFSDKDFGDAADDRWIFVSVQWFNSTGRALNSATIGGVTASIITQTSNAGNGGRSAIIMANVPSGTTGDIVLTFSGTFSAGTGNGVGIGWFTVYGPVDTTMHDSFLIQTSADVSETLNTRAYGAVIMVVGANNGSANITAPSTVDVVATTQYAAGHQYGIAHAQVGDTSGTQACTASSLSASNAAGGKIGISIRPQPVLTSSQEFDSGSDTWEVPTYDVLQVELWGGGASGKENTATLGWVAGNAGGATTVSTLSLTANGGAAAGNNINAGIGGTASGGDVNTSGQNGGAGNTGGPASGKGGDAPNGGTGGASVNAPSGNRNGNAGNAPGGGGSGDSNHTFAPGQGAAGGGSGAYCRKVIFADEAGAPSPEDLLSYAVGTGGSPPNGGIAGSLSGAGANGRVKFSWS